MTLVCVFSFQMVTMKLRRPYTTASMWSSGKITCTGANSEEQAKVAARKYARVLQKLGNVSKLCAGLAATYQFWAFV